MGATIVAAAAAQRHRVAHLMDRFRLTDATAPSRARAADSLDIECDHEFDMLTAAGVIRPGESGGTWYLDEAAAIAFRQRRSVTPKIRATLFLVVATLAVAVAALGAIVLRTH